jgi:multidrug efflux pump
MSRSSDRYFATVISLLIVVFGLSGLLKLPVREYPDIDPPEVSVAVNYRGAAPEVIDTQIVQIVEGRSVVLKACERIESRSRIGSAQNLNRSSILAATSMPRPTMSAMPFRGCWAVCRTTRTHR